MAEYQFVIAATWPDGRIVDVLVDVEPPVDSGPSIAPPRPPDETKREPEGAPRPMRHNIEAKHVASAQALRSFIAEITAATEDQGEVYALCFEPRLRHLYPALKLPRPPHPGDRVELKM